MGKALDGIDPSPDRIDFLLMPKVNNKWDNWALVIDPDLTSKAAWNTPLDFTENECDTPIGFITSTFDTVYGKQAIIIFVSKDGGKIHSCGITNWALPNEESKQYLELVRSHIFTPLWNRLERLANERHPQRFYRPVVNA